MMVIYVMEGKGGTAMLERTLKITNVLSDPTRFSIYQYICKRHNDVTVQEIAENFGIHANVARLHLTKLEDVKMLVSQTKKTGKGGRPSRYYRLSDEVVSLQFPQRDFRTIAQISLEALEEMGEKGLEVFNNIAYRYGKEEAEKYIQSLGLDISSLSVGEKLRHIQLIANAQGLNAEIEYNSKKKEASLHIYNCIFKELLNRFSPSLCKMHHSMLQGIFDYFLGDVKLLEKEIMIEGCNKCSYLAVFQH